MFWNKDKETSGEEVVETPNTESVEEIAPETAVELPKKKKKRGKSKVKVFDTIVRKGKFIDKLLHTEEGELVHYEDKVVASKVAVWYGGRALAKDKYFVVTL
jgi:hypothetical protein